MVHRALIHLSEKHKPREFYLQHEAMAELGQHCSMTERRADEATRDAMQSLKCQFMLDHVGEEFDGVVSGVAAFGIFVELKDVYIEGLIHVTELGNDYFHFDPVSHRFTGERSGKSFRLADSIRVRVVRVDVEERKIDLARVATGEEPLRKRGRGRQESSVESTQHAQRKRSTKRSESKAGRAQPVSRSNERTEGKRKEGKRGDVKRTGAKPAEAKRMDGKRTGGGSTKTAPKSGARPASGKSQTAKRKN
jgi:ribonuclease R